MITSLIALHLILVSTVLNIPQYPIQIPNPEISQKKPQKNILYHSRTLSDDYLDQVIHRKKHLIKNCTKKLGIPSYDFTAEITITPSGKTQARLIESSSDLQFADKSSKKSPLWAQYQLAQNCVITVLNRIRFKSFNGISIIKKYSFHSDDE